MRDGMAVYGLRHKRARLAGEITNLQLWNLRNSRKIEELQGFIVNNLKKIADLQEQIDVLGEAAALGMGRELPAATARRTHTKHHLVPWGQVTKSALRLLRKANGSPLTSLEIATAIAADHDLALSAEDLAKLRYAVNNNLRRLRRDGVVAHARSANFPGDYSSWVLADIAN